MSDAKTTRARTGGPAGDVRLAWLLTKGSDRREWWRVGLTVVGAAGAAGLGLVIAVLVPMDGQYHIGVGGGLLDQPGTRDGVVVALTLLLVPVFGFLGQCARIGAVHRDRRLAALRLAGAAPPQVRRIAGLETGLACLAGSVLATVVSVAVLLRMWHHPAPLAWAGIVTVALLVPAAGAAVSTLSLRRVVASPLGVVRRTRPAGPGRLFLVATVLLGVSALFVTAAAFVGDPFSLPLFGLAVGPLAVFALCLLVSAVAVWLTGWWSGRLGEALASRAGSAAVLIAAERLRADPWAAARTHAAVLLVTVVGTGFVGVRQALLADLATLHREHSLAMDVSYYSSGLHLTGAAIGVALTIVIAALAVGTAESVATRRRGLAAQTAAGVPRAVLGRALLLETALPLLPAVAVAGVGGTGIGVWYASLTADHLVVPYAAPLVPLAVYACCLLAAATSLPLLRRTLHPAELRYA
ncbi:FtsX-like permease family protein [Streptomyces griseorubiginosus]|uniref:FtsX-like permease family protein n=1 Tax=Streptomyces griseorubiginosus TaxID=67304 RepID=UPI001AD79E12|nr:FtsX-like permease family protein [Streptomyces griseorubiginosus]MBO4259999.1 ABC transporter permease [Streptomyces griseorubiginosus]